ncbi:MAG: hypothetical protein RIG62_05380 [Cyclobacteriaceae bacterium]
MKITCYILSLYFLALTGIACADTIPPDNTKGSITVIDANSGNQDHDHSDGWDGCSPLCICHCCHIHFFLAPEVQLGCPDKLPIVYTSFFQDFRSIEISGFLKPPRS